MYITHTPFFTAVSVLVLYFGSFICVSPSHAICLIGSLSSPACGEPIAAGGTRFAASGDWPHLECRQRVYKAAAPQFTIEICMQIPETASENKERAGG